MLPLKAARIAASVSLLAALTVLGAAAAGSIGTIVAAASAGAAAGAFSLWSLSRPVTSNPPVPARFAPAVSVTPQSEADRPARKRSDGTILVATLRSLAHGSERLTGDLHRVLSGIVGDERGAIDRAESTELIAFFSRSDHAVSAVHAAQRMLSNVDAVSRRLGHELRIVIAVHSGPRGDETLLSAVRMQRAATDAVPVLVSETAARPLAGQLERVDTLRDNGWQMDVFTFPPAQKRLPGL